MKGFTLVYEDEDCAAVNKDAGLAVQGGSGVGRSLESIIRESSSFRPHLVHRLDKDTSGAMIVAKSKEAAAFFSRSITQKKMKKRYLAVCSKEEGAEAKPEGLIDSALSYGGAEKAARTFYKLKGQLECGLGLWLSLELEPETGRMHQIRRHLSDSGLPILGDEKYGNWALNKKLKKELRLNKMLLHSAFLQAPLPSGRVLRAEAALPDYFKAFMPEGGGL